MLERLGRLTQHSEGLLFLVILLLGVLLTLLTPYFLTLSNFVDLLPRQEGIRLPLVSPAGLAGSLPDHHDPVPYRVSGLRGLSAGRGENGPRLREG